MVQYAIVKIGGQQYKVKEGMQLTVSRLSEKEGNLIAIPSVLLLKEEEKVFIGSPFLAKAEIKARIVKHFRGEKLEVQKFKAKVRFRKHTGFRPELTEIKIEKIENKEKEEKVSTKRQARTKKV